MEIVQLIFDNFWKVIGIILVVGWVISEIVESTNNKKNNHL